MKILSVSLYNIASIEGPFTIDLEAEPLKSAGLFAITGATGAGKSTILDAICLALYNDTPRLATTKVNQVITDGNSDLQVNNVKNLLRKGAVSGYAKVTFQAIDNKIYEAEWQVRRARGKQGGSLQSETILLYNCTDNEPFAENRKTIVLERIKELIGLTFDEFTKSVILAQGDFTSFLKADDNKRFFRYNPKNTESQIVQKTLFNEKKTIIENCLFGVDINPNSVKICRLRLWIELLKNAYYKNATELETLPNIDINIKNGNSLLSRFPLDTDLKTALKKTKISIAEYKNAFHKYQNAVMLTMKWSKMG